MSGKINNSLNKTHHFRDEMDKIVIIHHNSQVINQIKFRLKNIKIIENKNYEMYSGEYENKRITLITTFMGACNTGIIVDQVISQGAEYIFKLGTFGALQDKIKIGDIYIPIGAVRSEGLTDAYAPMYYPACPNAELFIKIFEKSKDLDIKINSGIIHSVNIYSPYYKETYNKLKYSPDEYRKINTFGVEMECSTTFVCSNVKKAKSIAVLICNRTWEIQDGFRKGKTVDWDKHKAEIIMKESTKKAIDLILETIKDLE